jgi:hypothetical protein
MESLDLPASLFLVGHMQMNSISRLSVLILDDKKSLDLSLELIFAARHLEWQKIKRLAAHGVRSMLLLAVQ